MATATLPEPDEDEYFHVDLIGCQVLAGARRWATVTDRPSPTPPTTCSSSRRRGTVLVPFSADVVERVDLPARRIDVREDFL